MAVNSSLVTLLSLTLPHTILLKKIKSYGNTNRSEWHLPGNGQVGKPMKRTVEISEISGRTRTAVPALPLFPTTCVTEGFGILVDIFPRNISQHQHHYKNPTPARTTDIPKPNLHSVGDISKME
jgi:hypothetical protein